MAHSPENPLKIERTLKAASRWVFLLTGASLLAWLGWNFRDPWVFSGLAGVLGTVLLILGLFSWLKPGRLNTDLMLSFLTACLLFWMVEGVFYLGISTGLLAKPVPYSPLCVGVPVIPFFNEPCAVYQSSSGYRWTGGTHRTVKIANGQVVFDNVFTPNQQGYISQRDYSAAKDSTVKRYLVFGDSYTAAYYLQEAWPDVVQDHLGPGYQLDAYAINGGGIANWSTIWEKEIMPRKIEFDGVIFAVFANDLDRDLFVKHHGNEQVYFKWLAHPPKDRTEFLQAYLPQMDSLALIRSDETLDQEISKVQKAAQKRRQLLTPGLYGMTWLQNFLRARQAVGKFSGQIGKLYARYIDPVEKVELSSWKQKYGPEKSAQLFRILEALKRENKEIIFASIPEKYGLGLNQKGERTAVQQEMEWLAESFGGKHFDGYAVLAGLQPEEINACFLSYDGHWSQKGSDRFARKMAEFLSGSGQ